MRRTRLTVAGLATTVLLTLLNAADAAPASATVDIGSVATPANDSSHPWAHDGCSASPERGPGWDFHHACIHHDGCYRHHWASRRTCDLTFLRDMRASCRVLHPWSTWRRWLCGQVANTYHVAVRLFGSGAYDHHRVDVPVR